MRELQEEIPSKIVSLEDPAFNRGRMIRVWEGGSGSALVLVKLENVDLLICPGLDGAIFFRDQSLLAESVRYFRPINAPPNRYRKRDIVPPSPGERMGTIDCALLPIDPGWTNYFHWLLFHVSMLKVSEKYLDCGIPGVLARYDDSMGVPRSVAYSREVFDQSFVYADLGRKLIFLKPGFWHVRTLYRFAVLPHAPAGTIYADPVWSAIRDFARNVNSEHVVSADGSGDIVFISRQGAVNRPSYPAEEREMLALLAPYGVRPVYLSGMSLRDQAAIFSGSRMVIGQHGSGLTNMVFCPPGTSILELNECIAGEAEPRRHFERLAMKCGHKYAALERTHGTYSSEQILKEIHRLSGGRK